MNPIGPAELERIQQTTKASRLVGRFSGVKVFKRDDGLDFLVLLDGAGGEEGLFDLEGYPLTVIRFFLLRK